MKKFGNLKAKVNIQSKGLIIGGIVALVFALVLWGIMMFAENMLLSGYEKVAVYVANEKIASGSKFEGKMVKKTVVDAAIVPKSALTGQEDMVGLSAMYDIPANSILTKDMFGKLSPTIENGKVLGLSPSDMAKAVNGTLRPSDKVDIYFVNEDGGVYAAPETEASESQPAPESTENAGEAENTTVFAGGSVLRDIYVAEVFDSNGLSLTGLEESAVATSINVLVTPEQADQIAGWILTKQVVVVKHEKNS